MFWFFSFRKFPQLAFNGCVLYQNTAHNATLYHYFFIKNFKGVFDTPLFYRHIAHFAALFA